VAGAPPLDATARDLRAKTSWSIDGDSATIDVETESHAIVALNQLAARGWRVNVDGREATPLVANGLFRAVAVSPGAHRIEWSYRPRFVPIGIAISAIALVLAILLPRFSREKFASAN